MLRDEPRYMRLLHIEMVLMPTCRYKIISLFKLLLELAWQLLICLRCSKLENTRNRPELFKTVLRSIFWILFFVYLLHDFMRCSFAEEIFVDCKSNCGVGFLFSGNIYLMEPKIEFDVSLLFPSFSFIRYRKEKSQDI